MVGSRTPSIILPSDAMIFSPRPGWGFRAKNRTTTFTFWADNFAATFAALFGVSIMAILPGSLGCPIAELPGTKALASRPLVNVLRDTTDIAPPEERLPDRSTFLLRFDLAEFGQRAIEYIIEEPHRIQNFAHGCGCFRSISLAEGKHAVVAQVSHDSRLGNPVIKQVA